MRKQRFHNRQALCKERFSSRDVLTSYSECIETFSCAVCAVMWTHPASVRPKPGRSRWSRPPWRASRWRTGWRRSPCAQSSPARGRTWRRCSPRQTSSPRLCSGCQWTPASWWTLDPSCWSRCWFGPSATCWRDEQRREANQRMGAFGRERLGETRIWGPWQRRGDFGLSTQRRQQRVGQWLNENR